MSRTFADEKTADEYEFSGKGPLFMALRFSIVGEKADEPYAKLAADLGLNESALRVAVHRLRQRYRQLIRKEIARTVATEAAQRPGWACGWQKPHSF
jgi:RNA polymerase sigma-70 factor (ECF subfamily)